MVQEGDGSWVELRMNEAGIVAASGDLWLIEISRWAFQTRALKSFGAISGLPAKPLQPDEGREIPLFQMLELKFHTTLDSSRPSMPYWLTVKRPRPALPRLPPQRALLTAEAGGRGPGAGRSAALLPGASMRPPGSKSSTASAPASAARAPSRRRSSGGTTTW